MKHRQSPLFLFFYACIAAGFFNIQNLSASCTGCSINIRQLSNVTFEFTATIPSATIPASLGGKQIDKYLWQFGDGRYKFDYVVGANQSTVIHTYDAGNQNPENLVSLTITPIKDDEDDPFSIVNNISCSNCPNPNSRWTGSDTFYNKVDMTGRKVKLLSNHYPSAGDTVIYIIILENCGDVETTANISFNVGTDIFDYINPISTHNINSKTNGKLDFDLFTMSTFGEQKTIFIKLKTKEGLREGITYMPSVNVSFDNSEGITLCDGTDMLEQKTVKSHDPNFKTVDTLVLSNNEKSYTLEYYIEFQNIGKGPAQDVVVTDLLHPYLDVTTFIFNSANDVKYSQNLISSSKIGRKATWEFSNNLDLEGTQQQGFNQTFFEEETRGWIKFRIDTDPSQFLTLYNQIIPNKADIIFDDNPVIPTEFAITKLLSDTCSFLKDTTIYLNEQCVDSSTTIKLDTLSILKDHINNLGTYDDFLLYNSDGSVEDKPAQVIAQNSETLLLCVSTFDPNTKTCMFYYFYLPIKIICEAPILEITDISYNCGDTNIKNYVSINVNGPNPPYMVSDGYTKETIFSSSGVFERSTNKDYLRVWAIDSLGCTSEVLEIDFGSDYPLNIVWEANDCMMNVQGVGGVPPYTYQWSDGSIDTTFDCCKAYELTVTDSLGCTNTLTGNCIDDIEPGLENFDFHIYTNLNDGLFYLSWGKSSTGKLPSPIREIEIINLNGQKVYTKEIDPYGQNEKIPIDLKSQAAGMYLISLKDKNGVSYSGGKVLVF